MAEDAHGTNQTGIALTRAWRQRRLRRGLLGLAAATLGAAALQQRESGTAVSAPLSGDSAVAGTPGVLGTNSAGGAGVRGDATATSIVCQGVWGNCSGPNGFGVLGQGQANTGEAIGVKGITQSPTGFGVFGIMGNTTSNGEGVRRLSFGPTTPCTST